MFFEIYMMKKEEIYMEFICPKCNNGSIAKILWGESIFMKQLERAVKDKKYFYMVAL